MALPHGPASVGAARRRLRRELCDRRVPETVVDDAVLILSELLSNACRHARPLAPLPDLDRAAHGPGGPAGGAASGEAGRRAADGRPGEHREPWESGDAEGVGGVLVGWQVHEDGLLTLEVTDGGAATRPRSARPSLTSHGGRGLSIVGRLASDWGVRDAPGEVTVWAVLPVRARHARRTAHGCRPAALQVPAASDLGLSAARPPAAGGEPA
ncbi:ATP-binding protein [Streptomyces sp. NPDC001380]|uniref:ATP-binding protein n=1 Tax=Streptomyces sp. NPDC001380 TaxID=3364566 RepID=UPI00367A7A3B